MRIPRTSFCVTSLIKKDAPRTAKKPNAKPQSLSLEDPTPRPSPPAHPFLSPLHRCQTTKRRPTGDTGCQGKTHQRALPPSQFHSEPKGPGLYAGPHPRQPPCPEPRKPLILRHADPPNGKLQPLCPGRLLPIFVEVFRAVRAPSIQRASRRAYRSNPHRSGDRSAPLRP